MPNYVRNIIRMKGIANLDLFRTYKDGVKGFDFNKLIEMPESLNMSDGSESERGIAAALQKICKVQFDTPFGELNCRVVVAKDFFKEEKREEYEKLGMKYIENIIKYGHPTWYGWACENWGTKWNACDTRINGEDEIQFDTAWSNPEPVIKKLAEKYPDAQIFHEWSDEEYGNNCGERTYDGHCWTETYDDDGSKEARNRANNIWHYDEEEEDE